MVIPSARISSQRPLHRLTASSSRAFSTQTAMALLLTAPKSCMAWALKMKEAIPKECETTLVGTAISWGSWLSLEGD
ncbi:hypothetical protein FOC1_g10002476 [Fusarium oxysporum f. sp. cubense race 1]|uniref:Uncharacterized protein n=1 Tax=Fusarium oxysporum f. sp. cubense (strain race 1) TaxID=1229664 RepID=N4V1G4_FUSC1|nr:hypothetical protein FOC1_g10002476 [Fusarium oxysporum f. sp. cubense race 1]